MVHSKDGANSTGRARFPCFVMYNNTDFVVTRHSVEEIQQFLMMMIAIPVGLWTASCLCVFVFSVCVKIDDKGHFRISSQAKIKERPITKPKSAWDDPILKKTQKKTLLNRNHLKEVEEQEEEEEGEGEGEEASKLIESKM
ncbi:uncharacterized protein LOC111703582 [Eurytemora carolleeae]|uniref:uncharacterized protein LOC111703582 n=1 Tax=Eurytemora carolleeae TaxID=1294199 RepID=UPI000C76855F|nr:uncharacterized protein LOC111703582 [Eurytemora carolleeae]|eukprot:XP_023331338.1 uncharacterized protein LOC111703582 [Eurytemora affinis]